MRVTETERLVSASMIADERNVALGRMPVLVKYGGASFIPMWDCATELQSLWPSACIKKAFKFGARNEFRFYFRRDHG
jgi:hypothetical protein